MAAPKPTPPQWLRLSGSCMPCLHGVHEACRHAPNDGQHGQFSKPDDGAPCGCEQHGHPIADTCRDGRMGAGGWSYRICGKPAKGTYPVSEFGHQIDQPLCGVHLAGQRRSAENEARWRADWAERDRKRDAEEALSDASMEWAQRLTDEFGVHAEGHRGDAERLLVNVQPEHLHGLLVTAAGLLRDVGVEWADVLSESAGGEGPLGRRHAAG